VGSDGRTQRKRWAGRWLDNRRLRLNFGFDGRRLNHGNGRRVGRFHISLGRFFDGDCRSVSVVLGLMLMSRRIPFSIATADGFESKMHSQLIGYVLIDGAGVRHFFGHSHFR